MGGRGGSSGISPAEVKSLGKSLTTAKSAESRAYKAYQSARGAERMTPAGRSDLAKTRREASNKAWEKYQDAKAKRESIENKLEKYRKKQRRSSNVPF